ncbi:unnamed protein product [Discosporangium mesarthrocarpum]
MDRFDVRWMLDPTDVTRLFQEHDAEDTKIDPNEQEIHTAIESLRYADLPDGDHSKDVEGLGRFAPEGSYALEEDARGLGGDDKDSAVYGYYGPTRGRPPPPASKKMDFSHTYPDGYPEEEKGDEVEGENGDGEEQETGGEGEGELKEHEFVPEFLVPDGILVPPLTRQHTMMVGTAKTTKRSPQLEVLLRLKQASNPAFSFLSDEDAFHPYYNYLKTWSEAALTQEYSRQQAMKAQREKEEEELRRRGKEEEEEEEGGKASPLASGQGGIQEKNSNSGAGLFIFWVGNSAGG